MSKIRDVLDRLGLNPDTATGQALDVLAEHVGIDRFEATIPPGSDKPGYAAPESDQGPASSSPEAPITATSPLIATELPKPSW